MYEEAKKENLRLKKLSQQDLEIVDGMIEKVEVDSTEGLEEFQRVVGKYEGFQHTQAGHVARFESHLKAALQWYESEMAMRNNSANPVAGVGLCAGDEWVTAAVRHHFRAVVQ